MADIRVRVMQLGIRVRGQSPGHWTSPAKLPFPVWLNVEQVSRMRVDGGWGESDFKGYRSVKET